MMKVFLLLLLLAAATSTVQGFGTPKPPPTTASTRTGVATGRRGFFTKSVEAVSGAAFFIAAATMPIDNNNNNNNKANAMEPFMSCDTGSAFDIANIASCHGESKEMTPSQEAYADYLINKMNIPGDAIMVEDTTNNDTMTNPTSSGKNKPRVNNEVLKNHMEM